MSYSRWGDSSQWYIFWHADSDDTKKGQLLSIWYIGDNELPSYSYEELKRDRQGVWDDIASRVGVLSQPEVFAECVDDFLKAVDRQFSETGAKS